MNCNPHHVSFLECLNPYKSQLYRAFQAHSAGLFYRRDPVFLMTHSRTVSEEKITGSSATEASRATLPLMLCNACQDIFSAPRNLAYGSFYPWKQTPCSYTASLKAGCQLCNVIEEGRSYTGNTNSHFPQDMRYAFKALGQDWARHGKGPQWLVPSISEAHEFDEADEYLRQAAMDPTPNKLGHLLAIDAEDAADQAKESWLVLELYGPRAHIVLPIEIATGRYRVILHIPLGVHVAD
jgi:hypothetical protein